MRSIWRVIESGFGCIALAIIGIYLLVSPSLCQAANNCPWINEATVSGLLGGNAVGQVASADDGKTTVCEFIEQNAGFKRILRLTVEVSADDHPSLDSIARGCGIDAVSLKAIGNEALICSVKDPKPGFGERVVGRVRNQLFTIIIYTTLNPDPTLTREALKVRIYSAAEQIAGNLF
ncbi:MAG: hypothetical protein WAN35_16820 [Terracidiphilus sp.]